MNSETLLIVIITIIVVLSGERLVYSLISWFKLRKISPKNESTSADIREIYELLDKINKNIISDEQIRREKA